VLAAAAEHVPLNALVARIDADRATGDDLPNLASAIRVWLFQRTIAPNEPEGGDQ
jgi:predicted DNA-binding ribbon-helix-helix protein